MAWSEGAVRLSIGIATAIFTVLVTAVTVTAGLYTSFVQKDDYRDDMRRIEGMIERLYEREFGRPYESQEPAIMLPRVDQPVRSNPYEIDGKFYNRAIPDGTGMRYLLYFSS